MKLQYSMSYTHHLIIYGIFIGRKSKIIGWEEEERENFGGRGKVYKKHTSFNSQRRINVIVWVE